MATLTNLFKTLSLTQIKDVNITSATLANKQILQYDLTSKSWKNVTNDAVSPPTYDFASSDTTNGAFKVTVTNADKTKTTNHISIRGLGSAAYENISKFVIASTDTGKTGYATNSIAADKLNNPFKIILNSSTDPAFCSFTGDNTVTLDIKSDDGISLTSKDNSFTIALDTTKVPVLSTAVATGSSLTSGYVYWDAATTGGGWKLNALTGGSTYTAGNGIDITSSIAVKLNTAIAINPSTGIYTTNNGLTLETAGLRINQTVTPVLSTAVSNTNGYVYWDATPTTGGWKLNALTGGSTSTSTSIVAGGGILVDNASNTVSVSAGAGLVIDTASKKLIVDDSIIAKSYRITVTDVTKLSSTSVLVNGVNFILTYDNAANNLIIKHPLAKLPLSILFINVSTTTTINKLYNTTNDTITVPTVSGFASGFIINMVF